MSQLDFFDDLGVEKDLETLFRHIEYKGYQVLFSAIKFAGEEPYIAYIHWEDKERYDHKTTNKRIWEVETLVCEYIESLLSKGMDLLKSKSSKERIKSNG